jgi:hypothetical protein
MRLLLFPIIMAAVGQGYISSSANPKHESEFVLHYSASHSRVAQENVGLQKEQKCNTFACHTCNEVRLCILEIRKKEVGNTIR